MLKSMPFLYSSPPKPAKEAESKKAAKPSSSSESEPDSVSIESSSEEAHPKDNMKTENHRQTPSLEHFPQPPLEVTGTDHVKGKHKKGLRKRIVCLFDRGGKSKENKPQKENCQLVTADQIKKLIKEQNFYEASQHLLIMRPESNSNQDNRSKEETLGDQTEIEALFEVLKQKVLSIIYSSISIASAQPELLHNAVRAVINQVEEEERTVHSQPRKWKEEWRNTIQKSVEERMKEPPLVVNKDLSSTANSFLHMGKTMKEDMITVVQHIKQHYPEHFQVCDTYAKFYHHCFSSQMEMFAQFGLSNRDIYLLLTWVQNFYPEEIKNHSVLVKELDEASLGNLLPLRQIKQLELTYLTHEVAQCQHLVSNIDTRALVLMSILLPLTCSQQDHIRKPRAIAENVDSVKHWLVRCLEMEVKRWTQGREPENLDGYFHSELSIDAIQAIYGAQKRAEEITPELGNQVSILLLTEFLTFLQSYRTKLEMFIKEKTHNQYFEAIIIANLNNCVSFWTHTEKNTDSAESDVKTNIFSILNDLQNIAFNVFLHRLFQELKPLFKKFTEKKSVFCTDIMDEIISVTEAHTCLFRMLKNPNRQAVMEKIHLFLVQAYIFQLLKKKVSFRSPEQQNQLSELIRRNASILYTFCSENGSKAKWLKSVLPSLSEIIRLQDPNAIMVEVSVLASKYPDISKRHLSAILFIKGNLSSAELKSILSVLNIRGNATLPPSSVFKHHGTIDL